MEESLRRSCGSSIKWQGISLPSDPQNRTVVYWVLKEKLGIYLSPSNISTGQASDLIQHLFNLARSCVFEKQSFLPVMFHFFRRNFRKNTSSPEVTKSICRVPSARFTQSPWYTLPAHLCWFRVRPQQKSSKTSFLFQKNKAKQAQKFYTSPYFRQETFGAVKL